MADSLHIQCRDSVAGLVSALSDTVPPAARVYTLWEKDQKTVQLPCVFVTTEGLRVTRERSSFEEDEYVFPVLVALAFREDVDDPSRADQWLYYSELLADACDDQVLSSPGGSYHTELDYDVSAAFDPEAYQYGISAFIVNCLATKLAARGAVETP